MPMPKGYKKKTGYGSKKSLGGLSYHQIAEKMNNENFKMNHSTARNIFVSGLIKIADNVTKLYGKNLKHAELKEIAIDPRFQEAISDYMREIQYEKSQEYNK